MPGRDDLPSRRKNPPTLERLAADGRVGEGDEHFLASKRGDADRALATELRARGADVRSVRRVEMEGEKNPDVVVNGAVTEMKTLRSPQATTVASRIDEARDQARCVVLDVRRPETLEQDALRGLAEALRHGGGDLDEVLIIGNGYDLHWTP